MSYVLSLDEGTSSARAALYDRQGRRTGMETAQITSNYPHPGWVEQDAEAIWRAQISAARTVLASGKIDAGDIAAIGITNQRETTVVWDRLTGKPVAPAIVWQCRRTADFCAKLAASSDAAKITELTGLVIDAYFSGSKIRWILDKFPEVRKQAEQGDALFGNIDTWLIWKLTNGAVHVTDYTNASRTMLMDLASGEWSPEMLRILGVPAAMLPKIVPSSCVVGETAVEHLGAAIPIAGIAGDQQAALAGQACFRAGLSKNTYGTGCFALLHTGSKAAISENKLLATRAASTSSESAFAMEGSVFMAGAAVQWLRDEMKLIRSAEESETIASTVADTGGVYLVPAFVGMGAPYWDSHARGLISGMTRSTNAAHIIRATLESIAYQTRDLIDAMEADSGARLTELRVDGGAARNNLMMQFQADILDCPIIRPVDVETTALGAAYLAGLATKFWSSQEEVENFWRAERRFEPAMSASERDSLFDGWKTSVARARSQG
jgi:glycerol kinase